ncbi:molybdenum cofactor biosynthesis protein MoaE [Actinomyces haliotis]|uniref:molybdenum cofactor biosynthesis protein MoaE n=1 Tax=Actinomyces haliotis TaxID=1280843 RepID=UPI002B266398|nr:molybdenum cofactor biosynthesis protein MoaE [Actinomyces haliotis]
MSEKVPADDRLSARIVRAEVTSEPISVSELADAVGDRAAGAVLTFDGVVRDHDGGRGVIGLTYSSHPSADEIVRTIAEEVAARPGLRAVAVVHRVGDLRIGETALGVAVSADHRAPAFDALREAVEEVKKRLPIWKHQLFEDGSKEWSNIA